MRNGTNSSELIRALPHIKALRGKTIVIKYGGGAMINSELKASVAEDIVFTAAVGIRVVLVHGGGPEIDAMLKAVGKEIRFVNGLRYTDEETMNIAQMVLCGKISKDICALIQRAGAQALGLCGLDGGLLTAVRSRVADLGLVGEIDRVNNALLENVLNGGVIPVVSPVAMGTGEDEGRSLNVNADTAAASVAAALRAEKLVLITDVRGILRNVLDTESLISEADRQELDKLKSAGVINGGMIPKVDCCARALDAGVKTAHIIDGRIPHSLLLELFTNEGVGTLIKANDV
ncbi:MAG: acetylglutamate kinase [Spirochaetaceae bacterium]|jgi:acetylglutamate kinase|nr:acetylglutamate kinase [Spirochaetaceae bacterium]